MASAVSGGGGSDSNPLIIEHIKKIYHHSPTYDSLQPGAGKYLGQSGIPFQLSMPYRPRESYASLDSLLGENYKPIIYDKQKRSPAYNLPHQYNEH